MSFNRLIKANPLAILAGFCFSFFWSEGQSIQNISAVFSGGKVIVIYDVVGTKTGQTYSADLYSSHDNYTAPLKQVTGDVGKNLRAGLGKRIVWDATLELGTFSGEITFKVKGELNVLPFSFKNPIDGAKFKRGKSLSIDWDGGRSDQNVKLTLFKGNDQILDLGETKNTGAFVWSIPKKFEKGTYSLRLSSGSGQEAKQSGFFTIKAKSKVMFVVLPVVAVGALVAVLAGGGSEKDGDLPGAPGPD